MHSIIRHIFLFAIAVCLGIMPIHAQMSSSSPADDDADIRINPQVETSVSASLPDEDVVIPSFIRKSANKIQYNGADWTSLRDKLSATDSSKVNIVHIGDSHLQADFATSVVRRRLQKEYGDAGRGLITPLKMAGTNEPRDYSFRGSEGVWVSSKLLKRPWATPMGFTGTSTTPMSGKGTLELATLSRTGTPQLFDVVRLFHSAPPKVSAVVPEVQFEDIASDSLSTKVKLPQAVASVSLGVSLPSDEAIYGVSLERSTPGGLLYHVIGNNGATYGTYNSVDGFASGVSLLRPDLVVVSLGANEAFSRMTSDEMYSSIGVMMERMRQECPDAAFLLTTPMECQRSSRVRRKGRRSRRTYAVNPRVAAMREVILRYGREHNVPVYDFYEVAGGAGASAKWIAASMMARDRIHNSVKGYTIQGTLLYDALRDSFSKTNTDTSTSK